MTQEPPSPDTSLTVTVIDETESLVDLERWAELVERVLVAEGVAAPAETNLVFVDRDTMSVLNEEHMGVAGPTDVLSFPIDGAEDADESVGSPASTRFVGDIVICPEVAADNSADHAGSVDDELALLLVHGSLHLLGHDHAEPEERSVMWEAERRLLGQFWTPLTTDPWGEP